MLSSVKQSYRLQNENVALDWTTLPLRPAQSDDSICLFENHLRQGKLGKVMGCSMVCYMFLLELRHFCDWYMDTDRDWLNPNPRVRPRLTSACAKIKDS